MTQSCGVFLVSLAHVFEMEFCHILQLTCFVKTEHARLRDHVASMPGQLDAQVHEGGKLSISSA